MPLGKGGFKTKKQQKQNGNLIPPQDAAATTTLGVNLSRFSTEEREAILTVVKRDLEIRCMEKHRLKLIVRLCAGWLGIAVRSCPDSTLEEESVLKSPNKITYRVYFIDFARKIRNGLLQEDSQAPLSLPGSANTCTICRSQFLILLNPRLTCSLCRREVCRRCAKEYNGEMLCRICSRDIFYRAMMCHWFYDYAPDKLCGRASDTIVKSLFKDSLPPLSDLTEEQLHKTICNYLKPERETYVNGVVITRDVMLRIENEQIKAFKKRYHEIRSSAVHSLTKVRANTLRNGQENVEKEIEGITSHFQQQTKEALRKLLQVLCITEEKYKMSLQSPGQENTATRVLEITQKQVEQMVGHKIKVPEEYTKGEVVEEDLESFVATVIGGPEDFFANILLEDVSRLNTSEVFGCTINNPQT
ncbi:unnamed protein product [Hydatigera taeniaeformis]|uniref:FYVE_2 domain-containing protein n=1 Tax=Hydatigena taeniaeformis TaxID=6205 RepID=A0A0R3X290_HYDTA|nr:unnamed protein product [Hydatigera taeniaeformis]